MIRKILIVCACAAVAGCGQNYFVKGHALAPSDRIDIVTAPAGALASNSHGNSCYTPCDLPLLTADGGEITIAKDGFHTERADMGVTVHAVYQAVDNPKNITVWHDFSSIDSARFPTAKTRRS